LFFVSRWALLRSIAAGDACTCFASSAAPRCVSKDADARRTRPHPSRRARLFARAGAISRARLLSMRWLSLLSIEATIQATFLTRVRRGKDKHPFIENLFWARKPKLCEGIVSRGGPFSGEKDANTRSYLRGRGSLRRRRPRCGRSCDRQHEAGASAGLRLPVGLRHGREAAGQFGREPEPRQ